MRASNGLHVVRSGGSYAFGKTEEAAINRLYLPNTVDELFIWHDQETALRELWESEARVAP